MPFNSPPPPSPRHTSRNAGISGNRRDALIRLQRSVHGRLANRHGRDLQNEVAKIAQTAKNLGASKNKFVKGISFRYVRSLKEAFDRGLLENRIEPDPPEIRVRKRIYPNGDEYKGIIRDGKKEVRGILKTAEGKYEGEFQNDLFHGQGTMLYHSNSSSLPSSPTRPAMFVVDPNLKTIESAFKRARWNFESEFKDDRSEASLASCQSELPPIADETYEGEWRRGKRWGRGRHVFPNGDEYEGGWNDDLMHGPGMYRRANGDTYTGEFSQNLFHDRNGRITNAEGRIMFEGKFERGKFHVEVEVPASEEERKQMLEVVDEKIQEVEKEKQETEALIEGIRNNDEEARDKAEAKVRERMEAYKQALIEKIRRQKMKEFEKSLGLHHEEEKELEDEEEVKAEDLTREEIIDRNIETLKKYVAKLKQNLSKMDEAEASVRGVTLDLDELQRRKEEVAKRTQEESSVVVAHRMALQNRVVELEQENERYFGGKTPQRIAELKAKMGEVAGTSLEETLEGIQHFESSVQEAQERLEAGLEELEDTKEEREASRKMTLQQIANAEEKIKMLERRKND